MKKQIINNFIDFIKLLERQKNGEFEFSNLDQVTFSLSMLGGVEMNDSVVPIGTGEFVALISHNVFPDDLQFIDKKGNFVVVIMELAHLNRVFLTRSPLITWTLPKK